MCSEFDIFTVNYNQNMPSLYARDNVFAVHKNEVFKTSNENGGYYSGNNTAKLYVESFVVALVSKVVQEHKLDEKNKVKSSVGTQPKKKQKIEESPYRFSVFTLETDTSATILSDSTIEKEFSGPVEGYEVTTPRTMVIVFGKYLVLVFVEESGVYKESILLNLPEQFYGKDFVIERDSHVNEKELRLKFETFSGKAKFVLGYDHESRTVELTYKV